MAFFVICGRTNCKNSTHAVYVAKYLSKQLPHFHYNSKIKSESEWPSWLDRCNSMNNWHLTKSPVIWKEVCRMGGQKYLIGGLGEFWEYCYDYYGFESKLSQSDLARIMSDDLQMQRHQKESPTHRFCILGASNSLMLQATVYELQTCINLKEGDQMEIRIFDRSVQSDPDAQDDLLEVVDEMATCTPWLPQSLQVVLTPEAAFTNIDYLIVLSNYSRLPGEGLDTWLERCREGMLYLADDLNSYARRSVRVILSHAGPTCFTASVLLEYCTRIRLNNIVAVTADAGISVISWMAEKIQEPVRNFWCPPVWGFPGLVEFINLPQTAIRAKVYRPFQRALLTKETTSLPKGVIQYEMRFFESYINVTDDIFEEFERKKEEAQAALQRQPFLSKIRALGSLLKMWSADEINDDIISLGIRSNGSFGFPVGICFSQAVCLNERGIWEPAASMPLDATTVNKINSISMQVENTLKQFGLGFRASEDSGDKILHYLKNK